MSLQRFLVFQRLAWVQTLKSNVGPCSMINENVITFRFQKSYIDDNCLISVVKIINNKPKGNSLWERVCIDFKPSPIWSFWGSDCKKQTTVFGLLQLLWRWSQPVANEVLIRFHICVTETSQSPHRQQSIKMNNKNYTFTYENHPYRQFSISAVNQLFFIHVFQFVL